MNLQYLLVVGYHARSPDNQIHLIPVITSSLCNIYMYLWIFCGQYTIFQGTYFKNLLSDATHGWRALTDQRKWAKLVPSTFPSYNNLEKEEKVMSFLPLYSIKFPILPLKTPHCSGTSWVFTLLLVTQACVEIFVVHMIAFWRAKVNAYCSELDTLAIFHFFHLIWNWSI